jgi:hypothetical protein
MSCTLTKQSKTAPILLRRMSPEVALFGLSAMSDLSPLCAPKRTSAERADQGDVRQRDFLCGGNVDRLG